MALHSTISQRARWRELVPWKRSWHLATSSRIQGPAADNSLSPALWNPRRNGGRAALLGGIDPRRPGRRGLDQLDRTQLPARRDAPHGDGAEDRLLGPAERRSRRKHGVAPPLADAVDPAAGRRGADLRTADARRGPAGDPARSTMSVAMHAYHGMLQVDSGGALVRDVDGAPILLDPQGPGALPLHGRRTRPPPGPAGSDGRLRHRRPRGDAGVGNQQSLRRAAR